MVFRYPDNLEASPMIGMWRITDALLLLFAGIVSIFIYIYGHILIPLVITAAYGLGSIHLTVGSRSIFDYVKMLYNYLFSPREWTLVDSSSWFTPSRLNIEMHFSSSTSKKKKVLPSDDNITLKDAAAQSEKSGEKKTFGQFAAENSGSLALILMILIGGAWLMVQMNTASVNKQQTTKPLHPITAVEVETADPSKSKNSSGASADKESNDEEASAPAEETAEPSDSN